MHFILVMLNIRLNLRSLTLKPDSEGHFVVRISSDSDKVPELASSLCEEARRR